MVRKMDFLVPAFQEIQTEAGNNTFIAVKSIRDRLIALTVMIEKVQEQQTQHDKQIASLRKAMTKLAERVKG